METKPLEIYSDRSNYGIVRMPERRFPGCVIQGDSLSILVELSENICKQLPPNADADLVGAAEELRELPTDRLKYYESVLGEHRIELPYVRKAH